MDLEEMRGASNSQIRDHLGSASRPAVQDDLVFAQMVVLERLDVVRSVLNAIGGGEIVGGWPASASPLVQQLTGLEADNLRLRAALAGLVESLEGSTAQVMVAKGRALQALSDRPEKGG